MCKILLKVFKVVFHSKICIFCQKTFILKMVLFGIFNHYSFILQLPFFHIQEVKSKILLNSLASMNFHLSNDHSNGLFMKTKRSCSQKETTEFLLGPLPGYSRCLLTFQSGIHAVSYEHPKWRMICGDTISQLIIHHFGRIRSLYSYCDFA